MRLAIYQKCRICLVFFGYSWWIRVAEQIPSLIYHKSTVITAIVAYTCKNSLAARTKLTEWTCNLGLDYPLNNKYFLWCHRFDIQSYVSGLFPSIWKKKKQWKQTRTSFRKHTEHMSEYASENMSNSQELEQKALRRVTHVPIGICWAWNQNTGRTNNVFLDDPQNLWFQLVVTAVCSNLVSVVNAHRNTFALRVLALSEYMYLTLALSLTRK